MTIYKIRITCQYKLLKEESNMTKTKLFNEFLDSIHQYNPIIVEAVKSSMKVLTESESPFIDISEVEPDPRDPRNKAKRYNVNYQIDIEGHTIEITGTLNPYNTGRSTEYEFEPDAFIDDVADEYYSNNWEDIEKNILNTLYKSKPLSESFDYDLYLSRELDRYQDDDDEEYERAMEEYGDHIGYAILHSGEDPVKVFTYAVGEPEYHPPEEWVDADEYGEYGGYSKAYITGLMEAKVEKTEDGYVLVSYTEDKSEIIVNAKVYPTEDAAIKADEELYDNQNSLNENADTNENNITSFQVFPLKVPNGETVAFARVLLNGQLQLTGLKILKGSDGLYVAYPNDAGYINRDLRKRIDQTLIKKYEELYDKQNSLNESADLFYNGDYVYFPGKPIIPNAISAIEKHPRAVKFTNKDELLNFYDTQNYFSVSHSHCFYSDAEHNQFVNKGAIPIHPECELAIETGRQLVMVWDDLNQIGYVIPSKRVTSNRKFD